MAGLWQKARAGVLGSEHNPGDQSPKVSMLLPRDSSGSRQRLSVLRMSIMSMQGFVNVDGLAKNFDNLGKDPESSVVHPADDQRQLEDTQAHCLLSPANVLDTVGERQGSKVAFEEAEQVEISRTGSKSLRRQASKAAINVADTASERLASNAFSIENDEEEISQQCCNGLILDIFLRKGKGSIRRSLSNLALGDPGLHDYAKDHLKRDIFLSTVWDDIADFYKYVAKMPSTGQFIWPKVHCSAFVKHVRDVVQYKQQVQCLNTEVSNWQMRDRLLSTHVRERFENSKERQDRMDDFWSHFHGRARRNELPPIMQAKTEQNSSKEQTASSRSALSRPQSAGALSRPQSAVQSGSSKVRRGMCFAEDEQWSIISKIEVSNRRKREDGKTSMCLPARHRPGIRSPPALAVATREQWSITSTIASGEAKAKPCVQPVTKANPWLGPPSSRQSSMPDLRIHQKMSSIKGAALAPLQHSGPVIIRKDKQVCSKEPTDSYLEACQRCWIVPTPLPFVTGHSWSLKAADRNMLDNDLRAVAVMLQEVEDIEEIDLGGNSLLTEKAIVPFLERLFGEPATTSLHKLVLRDCRHVGLLAMEKIRLLLSEDNGLQNLCILDLSHIQISMKCHLKLAKAVHAHESLKSLSLSDTGLGSNSWLARQCVEFLLHCPTLRTLDLSWNCFDVDVFQHLGRMVVQTRIGSLRLANCSSAVVDARPPPITFFLECLSHDKSLTSLDVSLNRMDFRCMLILEDVLEFHRFLHAIDLSHNPLGALGVRSALRLLARGTSGLTHFESLGCYASTIANAQTFNMTNPSGWYSLDLERPYHRSILRMLYKQCDKFGQQPDHCFLGMSYSKPPWTHCSKDATGIFQVPNLGTLKFSFSIDTAFEKAIANGLEADDFGGFLHDHIRNTKTELAYHKVIALLACWKELDGHTFEQNVFLQALSKDFSLTTAYFDFLCSNCSALKSEVIYRLLPCVTGGIQARNLCLMHFDTVNEFVRMHRLMSCFLDFNIENPTGHYLLHLESCTDYAVAERLLLLDRWEIVIHRRQKRIDTSQRGNFSHIRNETYQNTPLHKQFKHISDWVLPEVDKFEFDYVSGKRPPKDALVVNKQTFNNILVSVFDAKCSPELKVQVLHMVSHYLYISAKQLREILGIFKLPEHRSEMFLSFFLRIVDLWNAKIFRVRFDSDKELKELMLRIGFVTFFPFIQPENTKFEIDFQYYDQRLCLNILLHIAGKENIYNIRDYEWIHANGEVDPMTTGIPRKWEKFDDMPHEGTFSCTYKCAPEFRKFCYRKQVCETYGHHGIYVEEDKVMWWTGLQEAPEDVLEFLEFIIGNYDDVFQVFRKLDGGSGNGVLTLREFESLFYKREGERETIESLVCTKFDSENDASNKKKKQRNSHGRRGSYLQHSKESESAIDGENDANNKKKKQRIAQVFRYLDPGGEGSVSKDEWGILDQIWNEYQLSITEFVHFLQRTFGDDLKDSWRFLDEDGGGDLDLEEWLHAVHKIGFFGPAKCVFGLLDRSDDGSISWEEFEVLEAYKFSPA